MDSWGIGILVPSRCAEFRSIVRGPGGNLVYHLIVMCFVCDTWDRDNPPIWSEKIKTMFCVMLGKGAGLWMLIAVSKSLS